MKKKALALTAAFLAGTMAAPAFAIIQADSEIWKLKDIRVDETLNVDKVINVDAQVVNREAAGAAEAHAYLNVTNLANRVNPDIVGVWNVDRDALIDNSISDNDGITGVNQDLGDMNNQANVVALAYTDIEGGIAHSQAGTDQVNHLNELAPSEVFQPDNPNPLTQIINSVNGNTGITGVNQNSGHMNNQTNSAAVAGAQNPLVVLSDAQLGQVNAGNRLDAVGTVKRNDIIDSINGNGGITQVNQAGGHMNNQASAISIAAGIDSGNLSAPVTAVTSF